VQGVTKHPTGAVSSPSQINQKEAMEKQKLIRDNFPSHQFIHLRLFAFKEYPRNSWDAHQSTVAGLPVAGLVESPSVFNT
jgi:hypothetical protein